MKAIEEYRYMLREDMDKTLADMKLRLTPKPWEPVGITAVGGVMQYVGPDMIYTDATNYNIMRRLIPGAKTFIAKSGSHNYVVAFVKNQNLVGVIAAGELEAKTPVLSITKDAQISVGVRDLPPDIQEGLLAVQRELMKNPDTFAARVNLEHPKLFQWLLREPPLAWSALTKLGSPKKVRYSGSWTPIITTPSEWSKKIASMGKEVEPKQIVLGARSGNLYNFGKAQYVDMWAVEVLHTKFPNAKMVEAFDDSGSFSGIAFREGERVVAFVRKALMGPTSKSLSLPLQGAPGKTQVSGAKPQQQVKPEIQMGGGPVPPTIGSAYAAGFRQGAPPPSTPVSPQPPPAPQQPPPLTVEGKQPWHPGILGHIMVPADWVALSRNPRAAKVVEEVRWQTFEFQRHLAELETIAEPVIRVVERLPDDRYERVMRVIDPPGGEPIPPDPAVLKKFGLTDSEIQQIIPLKQMYERMRLELVEAYDLPDDWGLRFGYFPHRWLGISLRGNWCIQYKAGVDARGNPIWEFGGNNELNIPGYYSNPLEAAEDAGKLARAKNVEVKIVAGGLNQQIFDPVVRVSRARFWAITNDLAKAAELSLEDALDIVSGRFGMKESQRKYNPALLERTDAEGYARSRQQFGDVVRLTAWQHARSLALTRIRKRTQPIIEQLRKTQPYLAEYLQGIVDTAWGQQDKVAAALDATLTAAFNRMGIPVRAGIVHRSVSRLIRTNVFFQLEANPRFAVQQFFGPFQTTAPFVGLDNTVRAMELVMRRDKEALDWLKRVGVRYASWEAGHKGKGIASATERYQRQVCALAYWLHGKELGLTGEALDRYAVTRGIYDGALGMSAAETPVIGRPTLMKPAMLYRRFGLHALGILMRLIQEGNIKGAALFITTGIFGAGMSVFTSFLDPIILTVLGSGAMAYGLEKKYRWKEAIQQRFGKRFADFMERGWSALIGLDLSASFRLFPDIPRPENLAEEIAGAGYSPILRAVKAATRPLEGDSTRPDALMQAVAEAGGYPGRVANAIYQLVTKDAVLDRNGEVVVREEDLTRVQRIVIAGGLRPIEIADLYDMVRMERFIQQARTDEMRKAANAVLRGNVDEANSILMKWNERMPDWTITAQDFQRHLKGTMPYLGAPLAERLLRRTPRTMRPELYQRLGNTGGVP